MDSRHPRNRCTRRDRTSTTGASATSADGIATHHARPSAGARCVCAAALLALATTAPIAATAGGLTKQDLLWLERVTYGPTSATVDPCYLRSGFLSRLAGVVSGADLIAFTDSLPVCFRGDTDIPNISFKGVGKPVFDQRQGCRSGRLSQQRRQRSSATSVSRLDAPQPATDLVNRRESHAPPAPALGNLLLPLRLGSIPASSHITPHPLPSLR